jgi:EAL domain-containing protein (putative c-di-GMP-specific phosphodiesterase class I)
VVHHQPATRLRFSINVSGQTLEDEDFLRLLQQLAVPSQSVFFEIEESDVVLRPHAAQRFCEDVRACGGGIIIDGFGRRALSFASFAGMRPDFVKIDGALTRSLASDDSCVLRLQTIRRLAEALDVGLIAECVETQDVLLRLPSVGVTHVQGYGVCRPQPMAELLGREPQLAAA